MAKLEPVEGVLRGEAPIAARAFFWVSAGVLLFWGLHNGFLLPWEVRYLPGPVKEPVQLVLRTLVWVLPAALYLRRHDPQPLLVAFGVSSRVSPRGLAWSVLGGFAYLSAVALLLGAFTPSEGRASLLAVLLRLDTIYLVLKVTLEELLVRGFLLGQLVRFSSTVRAQVGAALIFGLMHLPGWLAFGDMGIGLVVSTVFVTILGVVLGLVARASNSILPAIALHAANNLMGDWLG